MGRKPPQGIVTMNVLRLLIAKIILAMALVQSAPMARAEEFPARPVKIIVQTAAGSSLDVMARLIAEPLSQIWGQQAIIVNQAGAGGLIAARATAASAADGYTLFLAGGSKPPSEKDRGPDGHREGLPPARHSSSRRHCRERC